MNSKKRITISKEHLDKFLQMGFKLIELREKGSVWEEENPQGLNKFVVKIGGTRKTPPTEKDLMAVKIQPLPNSGGASYRFDTLESALYLADKKCGPVEYVDVSE